MKLNKICLCIKLFIKILINEPKCVFNNTDVLFWTWSLYKSIFKLNIFFIWSLMQHKIMIHRLPVRLLLAKKLKKIRTWFFSLQLLQDSLCFKWYSSMTKKLFKIKSIFSYIIFVIFRINIIYFLIFIHFIFDINNLYIIIM